MTVHALLVAAGRGTRAGEGPPKQFRHIAGKAVIAHAVDALLAHPAVDRLQIVAPSGSEDSLGAALGDRRLPPAVPGGETRRASVAAGLKALAPGADDIVLIHDAARPFLPAAVIDRLLAALADAVAAIPVLPVADSLVRDGATVDRAGLMRVQTPQAFRADVLVAAHEGWIGNEPTDDAAMLRARGHGVAEVPGDEALHKLTTPADFVAATARFTSTYVTRVGSGYDVHRFAPGTSVWLCGIEVPYDRALAGHSDADVGLHALVDALLGAIGDGDIGSHFPPSDERWRGASSDRFLIHARDLVSARRGIIDHVDVTLICEAPKVGPWRDRMRARVAALLLLPVGQVSIKATTTEKLGFTGRREGIAAQAVATIRLPGEES